MDNAKTLKIVNELDEMTNLIDDLTEQLKDIADKLDTLQVEIYRDIEENENPE